MATKYYYWEKDQESLGANPFLSGGGGMQNPFLSSAGQNPNQQRMATATRESQNLTAKEQSLGMSPIEQPGFFSRAGTGALGALHWLFTPIRKATNALAGGLEETRAFNSQDGTNKGAAQGWSDPLGELKAAGKGLAQGWNEDKQYSFGRYIGDTSSDVTGRERGSGFAPVRFAQAVFTNANEKAGMDPLEFATRKYGPADEGTGLGTRIADSTLSDILGFYAENKLGERMIPARMGRTVVKGEATGLANPAKFKIANMGERTLDDVMRAAKGNAVDDILGVNNINQARKLVQSEFGISASEARRMGDAELFGLAQDIIGARPPVSPVTRVTREAAKKGFNTVDDLFNFATKTPGEQFRQMGSRANMKSGFFGIADEAQNLARSASGSSMKYAPDELRRIMEMWDPIRGWTTPMRDTQLMLGDKLAAAGRTGLGALPQGMQDVLGTVFRNMETSGTPHVRSMNEAIDMTKHGARAGVQNVEERLFKAVNELAPNITDNERRAMYYAIGMGKQLDDPEFLAQLSSALDIPASELQGMSRLKGFRDFIEGEFQTFKSRGEAGGLFKGIEDPYVPIFGKHINLGDAETGTAQALRQKMGGLRSIQKMRDMDPAELLNHSQHLATDDIVEAFQRYNRTFHNIERTRNLIDDLKKLGIVSNENKTGYDTLADVFKFNEKNSAKAEKLAAESAKARKSLDKLIAEGASPERIAKAQKAVADAMAASDAAPLAERLYIDKAYKGRLASEELGFLRDSPMAKALKTIEKATKPWKSLVTEFNPAYHARNTIDDFVRTNILGEGDLATIGKTVTRETGETITKGTRVRDWTKNVHGQWEYTPGADGAFDLTATDAKNLARSMGVSRTQIQEIGANSSTFQRLQKAVRDKTGIDLLKNPSQTSREAYFTAGLKGYGDAGIARKVTNADLIDYGDVSPLIRDVVRPLAPFATFSAKNPSVALESLLRNPGRFAQFDILRDQTAGGDQSVYDNLPEYLKDQGLLAWRDGEGNVQTFNPGLSQYDWQNFTPGKALNTASRLPHPVIQAMLGLMRGVDSNGIPIDTAEGYGRKEATGLAKMLLPTEQGPDGGQYTKAEIKFLFDTFLSGPQAMSTSFTNPEKFFTRGINKEFSEEDLILQALLGENRRRQGRLKGYEQMGGQVPKMSDLRSMSNNPFLSR